MVAIGKKLKGNLMWFRKFGYLKNHRRSIGYSRKHTAKMIEVIKGP